MRDNLLKEKHGGGLARPFGQGKMYAQLSSFYYCLGMRIDAKIFLQKCWIYQYAEGRS